MSEKKIRLLSVTKSTGGLAQYNRRLCTRLDPQRFEVEVICLSENNTVYAAELNALGIHAIPMDMDRYRLNPAQDLKMAWRLWRHIRQNPYDILLGHGSKAGFLVRLLGRLARIPAVYRLASMSFVTQTQGRKALFYAQIERLGALLGGQIVTVADATRHELVRRRIAPARQTSVIHTGIDLLEFGPPLDRTLACNALGLDPAYPVVGWAARLAPQKAPLDYVRAAALVVEQLPAAQFFLAGEGALETDVRALIETLGLGKKIILAPWQKNMPAMLSAFDVYVQTAHWEGLPQAVLEAMAMRRAVVVTSVDGTPEIVRHDMDGLLVEPGDVVGLASHIISLLGDESRRATLGTAARTRIEAQFTVERMVAQWEQLLGDLAQH
ncbi:MAG: glycosyltransferase family 4 protein [Chloroflexi bacterium]|nr:glycosyltransferase family 4 protein [Chloroflexota bacterium]